MRGAHPVGGGCGRPRVPARRFGYAPPPGDPAPGLRVRARVGGDPGLDLGLDPGQDPVDQGAVGDGGHRARGVGQVVEDPGGGGGHGRVGVGGETAAQVGQGGGGVGVAGRPGQVPDRGHGRLAGLQDGHRLLEQGRVGGHLEQAVDGPGGDLGGPAPAVGGGGQDRCRQASGVHGRDRLPFAIARRPPAPRPWSPQ